MCALLQALSIRHNNNINNKKDHHDVHPVPKRMIHVGYGTCRWQVLLRELGPHLCAPTCPHTCAHARTHPYGAPYRALPQPVLRQGERHLGGVVGRNLAVSCLQRRVTLQLHVRVCVKSSNVFCAQVCVCLCGGG